MALIATLTGLGRKPRCVLEVPASGKDRLGRIFELLSGCGSSLHDLSRVALSGPLQVPRFNMPFELGIAYCLGKQSGHRFFVMEERAYRLQASLSDFNGLDPHIHEGTQEGILACLLDCFGTGGRTPAVKELKDLTNKLSRIILRLQREQSRDDPFSPHLFRRAVEAATELALLDGLIAEG
ncbi:MAG: hypothetical protein ACJ76J_18175 [Thermoanaerobaculia bacterium]